MDWPRPYVVRIYRAIQPKGRSALYKRSMGRANRGRIGRKMNYEGRWGGNCILSQGVPDSRYLVAVRAPSLLVIRRPSLIDLPTHPVSRSI